MPTEPKRAPMRIVQDNLKRFQIDAKIEALREAIKSLEAQITLLEDEKATIPKDEE